MAPPKNVFIYHLQCYRRLLLNDDHFQQSPFADAKSLKVAFYNETLINFKK